MKINFENKKVIIYGAHLIAVEAYRYIKNRIGKDNFRGFAVTEMSDNPKEIAGHKVRVLSEYTPDESTVVVIATPNKYHQEIAEYIETNGFHEHYCIDQCEMEILKSEFIFQNHISGMKKYDLYEDTYDKSWLNIRKKDDKAGEYYKFPTLYHSETEEIIKETENTDLSEVFKDCFGGYNRLDKFKTGECKESGDIKDILKIYMVFSHRDNGKKNSGKLPEWIVPIQAGSILTEEKSDGVLDETGENISSENSSLAELTAAYWIWKNDNGSEYKGLCHYRRHFVISEDEIRALKYNNVDVILTTPRYAPGGVGKMFLSETPVKETVFENMFEAIGKCSINDIEPFKQYIEKPMYVPNNMVIARNEIYNRYCEWLFPILLKMLESDAETRYGHETDRHIAYAAEILTSFYFGKNKDFYKMTVTDYEFYC